MVIYVLFRLFYNAVLLFIFIYIDILSMENGGNYNGGIVLLVVGVYGSVYMVVKTVLALYYHFKWLILEKCCLKLTDKEGLERKRNLERFWIDENKAWTDKYQGENNGYSVVYRRRK